MQLLFWWCLLWSFQVAGQRSLRVDIPCYLGQEVFRKGIKDPFLFLRNSAALSASGKDISVYAEKKYLLKDLHTLIVAATLPYRGDGFGFGVAWQGNSYLSNFSASMGFGKSLGSIDAGLQLTYHVLQQRGYGRQHHVQASAGMIWTFSEAFRMTVEVARFLPGRRVRPAFPFNEIQIDWGWGYQFSSQVLLWIEASKAASFPLSWNGGIIYTVSERIGFSGGWQGKQHAPWLGCRWQTKSLMVHLYGTVHPVLGFTPGFQGGFLKREVE